MKNINSLVELKFFRIEKEYKDFYQSGNVDLAIDINHIHKNCRNFEREYTKAWIKLLTRNSENCVKN